MTVAKIAETTMEQLLEFMKVMIQFLGLLKSISSLLYFLHDPKLVLTYFELHQYQWMRNILIFIIAVTVLFQLIEKTSYRKYAGFVTGMILILLIVKPLLSV